MEKKFKSDKQAIMAIRKELVIQIKERKRLSAALATANKRLVFQDKEKGKRAVELGIANIELAFQDEEKEKRAAELGIANKEKGQRAAELGLANKELVFQNEEKKKRAKELIIANYARGLIEASLDPLFVINPAGKITDINNASVNITGKPREKLIGSDFFNYFTEPDKARRGYKEVFAKGFVADYHLTLRDDKKTDVLFNGSVYRDEQQKVLGVVVVARDITDQKRTATELIEAKVFAELATEIAEEAKRKAEDAARIAGDAVKSKQQFLSNMSHEIRTPMNAIIGFTKVVLKTHLTVKQKEYLTAIKVSGDALIVLINDILDLAKVDAGKMSFEQMPFKMITSISALLHLFEPKILEKNIELVKEIDERIPEMLIGDSVRLHQIILNLVSNAVKFTATGKITVGVRLLKEDQETVTIEFSVADTGIGIAANKIDKIFENFQQASSNTSRLYGGTGLGLAIVKQLVENQNGAVSVKSKIDKGSVFSFVLNFQKTNADAETEENPLEMDSKIKNIKVLVVEDIPINQLLMKTLLDDYGFEYHAAANGKIAIEKLKKKSYDIILMDLQMPEMNGFEATEYIRKKISSGIPIIALTADVTTVDLQKCKAVGMDDYLAKPIDEKVLYRKIVGLIRKSKLVQLLPEKELHEPQKKAFINMDYLNRITKSDPKRITEMISLYLKETPLLVKMIKQSTKDGDWHLLDKAMHKVIPSFSIVGIDPYYEDLARKAMELAAQQKETAAIPCMISELENMWTRVYTELRKELSRIKTTNL